MATKFFKCETCGNIVVKLEDSGVIPVCCGDEMTELESASTDGKHEYHVPVVDLTDETSITVSIGAQPHPMSAEHYIQFICLETENGIQVQYLKPGMQPVAFFCRCNDKMIAVYAYCNRHGLWKTEI